MYETEYTDLIPLEDGIEDVEVVVNKEKCY